MEILINACGLMLIVLMISFENAMSTVTLTQSNSEVIVGGTTSILCVTTSLPNEVYWFHFPAGGPAHEQKEVYAYGTMHMPYRGRFDLHINRTEGFYQLVIPRVELTDAGIYSCQEDEGSGEAKLAQLTVLEASPTCTSTTNPIELIGPNNCNKEQENLTLACSVAYRGSVSPTLEWKMVGANNTVSQGLTVEKAENRITLHLTMPSQPFLDGSSFVCQTTKSQLNCTSDVINVIYATGISSDFTQKALIGDTVVCTANTSESCSYRWKWFKGSDVLTVSNNRTLTPKQSGDFRCEADCIIGKESCTIAAMFANVENGNSTSTTEDLEPGPGYVVLIVVVTVSVIIAIILLLAYLLNKRYRKKKNLKNGVLLMEETDAKEILLSSDIPKRYRIMPFVNKGFSGEICGPFIFQSKTCVCERIMQSPAKVKEDEICKYPAKVKEDEICANGKRWMQLDHQNVLKFYDVLFQSPALYIVMEYAEGGSVRRVLDSYTEDLEIGVVKDWATQIANGMNYLHDMNIVHGHLKAAQILIMKPFDPTKDGPTTLKIASYRLTMDSGQSAPFTFQGMFGWMAPEVIGGESPAKPSDVWSYGVTVWEILTKEIPYKGIKQAKVIKDISEGNLTLSVPNRCPNAIRDILNDCWKREKGSRPTFTDIVSRLHAVQAVADC